MKIEKNIKEISKINNLQQRDQWVNDLHPLVKLSLTIVYIVLIVSVNKYDLATMVVFAFYPILLFNMADLSLKAALYRLRIILPLVIIVGIFNPIFDKEIIISLFGIGISGGVVSMITLMLKGIFSVFTAYILIATTSIEDICYALRIIKVPKILVTVILLIYRYIYILSDEASTIMTAYKLRAPSQKGIHYKVWGPLIGQWLLRSIDRAEIVYESMMLRGFSGEFYYCNDRNTKVKDVLFFCIWIVIFIVFRFTSLIELFGSLFV